MILKKKLFEMLKDHEYVFSFYIFNKIIIIIASYFAKQEGSEKNGHDRAILNVKKDNSYLLNTINISVKYR